MVSVIGCPLVVSNIPLYTGNPMGPGLLARLMGIKNVIGVKNISTDMGIDSRFCAALCMQLQALKTIGAL